MNYAEIVKNLEARGMMPDRPPGLEVTRQGLEKIGFYRFPFWERLKKDPQRCVVVAGTNGKGSVCATLEALCSSAGERVGLYTSPHLIETTERIRLGGQDVSQELFCEAFYRVTEGTEGLRLTHFEALTLMTVWCFCSGEKVPPVDRMVLEVGLGGTWDSTNAVPHGMAVITRLGLDHTNLLGSTLAEIATNKFGIVWERGDFLPQGMTVVHHPLPEEVQALARETQRATGSMWTQAAEVAYRVEDLRHLVSTPWGEAEIPLPGLRGAQNTAIALTAFEQLGFDPREHLPALSQVRWSGRMQRVPAPEFPCPLYLSGDHNPQGIESLLELLPSFPRRHLHLLVGVAQDKDSDGILGPLFQLPDTSIYLTQTPYRVRKISDYGDFFRQAQGAWDNPREALKQIALRAQPEDLVVVTGSLYLVGAVAREFTLPL